MQLFMIDTEQYKREMRYTLHDPLTLKDYIFDDAESLRQFTIDYNHRPSLARALYFMRNRPTTEREANAQ